MGEGVGRGLAPPLQHTLREPAPLVRLIPALLTAPPPRPAPPRPRAGQPAVPVTKRVLREFAALHHELTEVAGVKVNLFQHR